MRKTFGAAKAVMLAAASCIAAIGPAAAQDSPSSEPKRANWAVMVAETEGGHRIGNPEAKAKLVEYVSYTCSHCAEFARTGDGALKLLYVPTGKINYEIRHLVRDPVDLAAALLTHCGPADKFFGNHEAIMIRQDVWLDKARKTTQAQRARWQFGTVGARFQAIASDLDFYEIMLVRGYSRPDLDKCLSDEAKANSLAENSRADMVAYDIKGTPSFMLDGTLLEGTHGWEMLQPHLDKAI
ncbi:thioredoxin domain-containing protein [Qipengyuania marisflavi]|uniref:Protein-disulfide isomerase n=1 Tax=Qipengyuania marisflavi TaxID=2486356 RepID=A0A5S3PAD0_9SPHN|nr:thioredoxin domain-containing protein [Qipengyuania marisflavi]TMM50323.1 protein-disulfide isomerase [Qipengyuania marisflavi]